MSIRILHVLDHSIPLHSGYSFRTLSILREQRRLGWDTFHLTSSKQGPAINAEEVLDGFHFYRTPASSASLIPAGAQFLSMYLLYRRLWQVAREVRPDVLHVHSPVLNVLPALWVGRILRIPVVYEVRAFWEDAAVDHGTTKEGSLRYRLTHALETWAFKHVRHVFTICEGLRGDIVSRGISPSSVTVIPNAVDSTTFIPGGLRDEPLLEKLGLQGKQVLGFIGSFYAYEGLDVLLNALPAILRLHPDVRVLLVGGGAQADALKAQAKYLNIADKVIFTGRVPHLEVALYYDLMDVLVYPRRSMRLTELVTPLKPLEAMAQGRLLVASDVGGHRELIEHGSTGLLFNAGSAEALASTVTELLMTPDTWPLLRLSARCFVERNRNWKSSVALYAHVYDKLVGTAEN